MKRQLLGDLETIYIIVIIISSSFEATAKQWGAYKLLKTSFSWPTSFCNMRERDCHRPFIKHFAIHGVWPMYTEKKSVKPFNKSGCSKINPTRPREIDRTLLATIAVDLTKYWPNIEYYKNESENEWFWRWEWIKHGRCYKYPTHPISYYETGLRFIRQYDFLKILAKGSIYPKNELYKGSHIAKTIFEDLGVKVEIACNTNSNGVLQLKEVRMCFDLEDEKISCEREYSKCSEDDEIQFPSPEESSDS